MYRAHAHAHAHAHVYLKIVHVHMYTLKIYYFSSKALGVARLFVY